jgi:hypothetical protein
MNGSIDLLVNDPLVIRILEPIGTIEFHLDSVRFTVRRLENNEIREDQMGDSIIRDHDENGIEPDEIQERIFYRLDFLSEPISYSNLLQTLEDHILSLDDDSYLFVIFDRIVYCRRRRRFYLKSERMNICPNFYRTFFHAERSLLLRYSRYQPMLFHGPSGNGKSFAIGWLARQLNINIVILSFETAVGTKTPIWDYLLGSEIWEDSRILVLDPIDPIVRNPEWLKVLYRLLEMIRLKPQIMLIATVRDISTLDGTELIHPSKFKAIPFDYPNQEVMNQISQHYYQRDYLGSLPEYIPIDTIREYARTKSYEEFTTMF